jgi:protein-disulfide isomerase
VRALWIACFALTLASTLAIAQTSVPPNQVSALKDTSSLKPPPGAKVAIIEYEDLECPYCARAFPFVHAAAKHYQIPIVECDFQISYHHWSHDAAICAHYLKARVSPTLAEEYRRELFASQTKIASRDDALNFTQLFFKQHHLQMPFVMDPTGQFSEEIDATTAQGNRIGLRETPSIFVVTNDHWIQVKDPDHLYEAIDQAEAEVSHTTVPRKSSHPGA